MTFWIWAYSELVDKDGSNTVGQMIIGAYLTQLFLSADFMFYYVRSLPRSAAPQRMEHTCRR